MSKGPILLQAENLSKRFGGKPALTNLNLEVRAGEIFGFLGPNGAGKTTFMRVALRLLKPSEGRIFLFGKPADREFLSSLKRIGALVELPRFYPYLSGFENLKILSELKGHAEKRAILEALDLVGLTKVQNQKVRAYSQGMVQRLGIGAAILGLPEFILLDEPTNGLDPSGMREIRNLLRTLASNQGKTIFLSSHLLHEVEQICDRVAILKEGKVKAQGEVEALLQSESGRIRIVCTRPQEALEILKRGGFCSHASLEGPVLFAKGLKKKPEEINAHLVRSGFDVSEFTPMKRTLEDFFLEQTGEEDDLE